MLQAVPLARLLGSVGAKSSFCAQIQKNVALQLEDVKNQLRKFFVAQKFRALHSKDQARKITSISWEGD